MNTTLTNHTIKAIFCDIGNVLGFYLPRLTRLYRLAEVFNPAEFSGPHRPTSEAQFIERLKICDRFDFTRTGEAVAWKFDTGAATLDQLYHAVLQATNVSPQQVSRERFWAMYQRDNEPIPETCTMLRLIQATGIKLIAATNCESWHGVDIVSWKHAIDWNDVVMSWQVGALKPDQKFFDACRLAAERLYGHPVPWSECLLIDDVPEYGGAFRQLGGQVIQFEASRDAEIMRPRVRVLCDQLKRYGVIPKQAPA